MYSLPSPRTWKAALLVLPAWRSEAILLLCWRSLECVLRLALFSISSSDGFSKGSLGVHSILLETFSPLHWSVFDTLAGTRVGSVIFYSMIYSISRCLYQLVRICCFAQSSFDMTCWASNVSVSRTLFILHILFAPCSSTISYGACRNCNPEASTMRPLHTSLRLPRLPSTLRFTSSWLSQINPSGLWYSAYSIWLLHCDSRYSLLSLFCVINTVITTEHNTWPEALLLSDPGFIQIL